MIRGTSFSIRATRAFVGLITVWCLGCSGYDPLLGSLLGASARSGMLCESERAEPGATDVGAVAGALGADSVISAPSATAGDDGFDCGCGSCHAPSPDHSAITALRSTIPDLAALEPSEPASVSRTPLLPPPELPA